MKTLNSHRRDPKEHQSLKPEATRCRQGAIGNSHMLMLHQPTLLLCVLLLAPAPLPAQVSLDWWSVDGGGGQSTGGAFTVAGTVGQPDAGRMSGGSFSLDGGFWGGIAAIQTPVAPWLSIVHTPGQITVAWPRPAEGWLLDWAPDIASPSLAIPWTLVPVAQYQTNATHIFLPVTSVPGSRAFFRLRKL